MKILEKLAVRILSKSKTHAVIQFSEGLEWDWETAHRVTGFCNFLKQYYAAYKTQHDSLNGPAYWIGYAIIEDRPKWEGNCRVWDGYKGMRIVYSTIPDEVTKKGE